MVRTLPPSQSLDESKSRPWGPPVIPSKSLDESKIQPGGRPLSMLDPSEDTLPFTALLSVALHTSNHQNLQTPCTL